MKRTWMGLAVVISAMGLLLTGALTPTEGAATRTVSEVQVVNFPAVQGVAGTVNVGNLPAVQMVEVVNPPAPTVCPQPIHFVGFTMASYTLSADGILETNRACNLDFSNTRACSVGELVRAIPTPVFPMDGTTPLPLLVVYDIDLAPRLLRMTSGGALLGFDFAPVACCGY